MTTIYRRATVCVVRGLQKLFLLFGLYFAVTRASTPRDRLRILEKMRATPSSFDFVRIGGGGDGGYVLPDLGSIPSFCISPGVGPVSDLEAYFDELGVPVLMLDASVDGPARPLERAVFLKKFLGSVSAENFISIDECLAYVDSEFEVKGDNDGLLQMDIEGAEYLCLLGCSSSSLRRFSIISLELHHLDRYLLSCECYTLEQVLEKLRTDFTIIHLHANNCCGEFIVDGIRVPRVMEMTLVRRDLVDMTSGNIRVGGGRMLDKRCVADRDEIILSDWFFDG